MKPKLKITGGDSEHTVWDVPPKTVLPWIVSLGLARRIVVSLSFSSEFMGFKAQEINVIDDKRRIIWETHFPVFVLLVVMEVPA